jgi:Tfp pilus assembly protein PilF
MHRSLFAENTDVSRPVRGSALVGLCVALVGVSFSSPTRAADPPAAAKLECVVLTREGKVDVARKGTAQWAPAQTNQVLQLGDRLRTGLRSRATLRWSDLSVVRVDELTSMEIQPPAKPGDKPQLDLKSGASYFFSRERPTEVQFRTPVASGAIRGTEFNLAVDEATGRTVLSLLDGEVDLSAAQSQLAVQSGEQATIEAGRAPTKTALIDAISVIQWALYYPAVVDPDELGLSDQEKATFADALKAYRDGDLPGALAAYPENRQPATEPERAWQAALLLAAGRVSQVETHANALPAGSPIARALAEVIAAVKNRKLATLAAPASGSEWLARSYYEQARSQLTEALAAAREGAKKSPRWGAAWVRVAELEFSFGRTAEALEALNKGLELSPRHAQGLALRGFLLAAQNKNADALAAFDRAIGADGALGNAWLGRGLVKIRTGRGREGREDLQVAATLEPQRAVLRSYLGKAFTHTWDAARARKELDLARKLDPNDPTSWLYSALLHQEQNRVNEAVRDLERSKELNDNRSLFRSRLLLDQDRAVRSANLAAIYRDAGMFDFSVQEAARAVSYDYANYSAHLFLANSYEALRDPKLINLLYETPAVSELLVANLLAPAGAGALSQRVSQQEYSRLFDGPHLGIYSGTEYYSSGEWVQRGAQYGNLGNFSYSLDAYYRTDPGQRRNNDLEQLLTSAQVKQQLTPQDSLFLQVSRFDAESGDIAQYYNQRGDLTNVVAPSLTSRVMERQEPTVVLGYHREWRPGSHTLFLAGRLDDSFRLSDSAAPLPFLRVRQPVGGIRTTNLTNVVGLALGSRSDLVIYSAELQQLWQTPANTLVAGVRYQAGWPDTTVDMTRDRGTLVPASQRFTNLNQSVEAEIERVSAYAYDFWQMLPTLRLTLGVSYDRLYYPVNIDTVPITNEQETRDQASPKVGLLFSPGRDTHFRALYTRSLGGVFFDASYRLEPTQLAGFNHAYRSLIPESVVGLVPATRFETVSGGMDHAFKRTGTYLTVDGELLRSDAMRTIGLFLNLTNTPAQRAAAEPSLFGSARQSVDYEEKSLRLAVNQLICEDVAVGMRYRLTDAHLRARSLNMAPSIPGAALLNPDVSATLNQVTLFAIHQHRCGYFGQIEGIWTAQSNRGYTPDLPGDDFWQFNVHLGYRFLRRRAEVRVGLLNVGDRDYRLNPLTLHTELPRERTFVLSFKAYF